jgi:hypothetical protein
MLELALGAEQRLDGLIVFPVLSRGPARLPCELLTDALAQGRARVREVGSGSVPTLGVENAMDVPVLVLDGEQLIGARQNRTTNRSILLRPGEVTEIPVSCMEQGRWRFVSEQFRATRDHSPTKVRRKAREVEERMVQEHRMATAASLSKAQSEVWSEIAELSGKLGVHSDTGALDEAYEARRPDFDRWAEAFPRLDAQVGLLALTPREVIGMDLVGCHRLYPRVHDRLLRGYLMDALDRDAVGQAWRARREEPGGDEVLPAARSFVEAAMDANRTLAPSVGLGDYHVLTGEVVGGELGHGGRVAHLSAFPRRDGKRSRGDSGRAWRF